MARSKFVLRLDQPPDRARLSALEAVGAVVPLAGASPGTLVVAAPDEARATWQRLLAAVGGRGFAAPVLQSEDGDRFPTGRIVVRFAREPSDDDVAQFARRHRLVGAVRNEFARQQVGFESAAPGDDYLPETLAALAADPAVARAWPETLAAYRRG